MTITGPMLIMAAVAAAGAGILVVLGRMLARELTMRPIRIGHVTINGRNRTKIHGEPTMMPRGRTEPARAAVAIMAAASGALPLGATTSAIPHPTAKRPLKRT